MWNPFKRKFFVPIQECGQLIIDRMLTEGKYPDQLFDYVYEKYGVKHKWNNKTMQNYLVFNNENDYIWFLLKL